MRWTLIDHFTVINNDFSDLCHIAMSVGSRTIVSAGVTWCDPWEIEIVVVDLDIAEIAIKC